MRNITATLAIVGSVMSAVLSYGSAGAQVQKSGNFLNLSLAMEAAAESARICAA